MELEDEAQQIVVANHIIASVRLGLAKQVIQTTLAFSGGPFFRKVLLFLRRPAVHANVRAADILQRLLQQRIAGTTYKKVKIGYGRELLQDGGRSDR